MPEQKTVTFDDYVYQEIKKLQSSFIRHPGDYDDITFTTTVNMLVLGGLVFAPSDPGDEEWERILNFLEDKGSDLDQAAYVDKYAEALIEKNM